MKKKHSPNSFLKEGIILPPGLAALLTAKAMGATELVITDLIANKLDMATELGATQAFQVSPSL